MKTSRTTFPFYEEDKQAIRAIREHYGVRSDAEAIRIALRELHRRIKSKSGSSAQAPGKDSLTSP